MARNLWCQLLCLYLPNMKYLFIENISPFLIGSNPQANSSRRLRYPINDMNGTG